MLMAKFASIMVVKWGLIIAVRYIAKVMAKEYKEEL